MTTESRLPFLPLPAAQQVPVPASRARGGGNPNPQKSRQIQRLGPQFLELQRVVAQKETELSSSPLGAAPEHVVVFETNGPLDEFYQAVQEAGDFQWLFEFDDKVDEDDDFHKAPKKGASGEPDRSGQVSRFVYMVLLNRTAVEQLISAWQLYQRGRMPAGLGHWSKMFACLREIRRWGPSDRLRDAGLLEDALTPLQPDALVPVEIELWPTLEADDSRAAAVRVQVEAMGGKVLHHARIADIHYEALLVHLPGSEVRRLIENKDVSLLQVDSVYLLRPAPQALVDVPESESTILEADIPASADGEPVVALLDGLPMENHPLLQGRLIVDDPDGWSSSYPVAERKHGTAMASLLTLGDTDAADSPAARPVYVRPILNCLLSGSAQSSETAPRERLWVDLIHEAVRRAVAADVPGGPVAPSVRIINLSVGDLARPFLNEPSPLARLLDWLSWKYKVLFVVSAGNHDDPVPIGCESNEELLKHRFEDSRNRRLLSPAESINALTVGASAADLAPLDVPHGAVVLPNDPELPAPYSALGRGVRNSVKPDVFAPGGRRLFRRSPVPGKERWEPLQRQNVGHSVAIPSPAGVRQVARAFGTSNAAVLTSKLAGDTLLNLLELVPSFPDGTGPHGVPLALLTKCLLVHSADWPGGAVGEVLAALGEKFPSRAKDHAAGLLGYGNVRRARCLGCDPDRATMIGGGAIRSGTRVVHGIPIPASLHAQTAKRRLTVTLAWFSPVNPRNRKYRVANLSLGLPAEKETPLGAKRDQVDQVHGATASRGTVEHVVLERSMGAMDVPESAELEIFVSCAADGGPLSEPVEYALAVSLETAPGTELEVYIQTAARLRVPVRVPSAR